MEVHHIICDFCGRKIEEGKRIASTIQRIRRTPEYKFKFDLCTYCYEHLKKEARMCDRKFLMMEINQAKMQQSL